MLSRLRRNIRGWMAMLRMPPFARILHLAMGYRISRALYVVTKLGVADLLKDGPKSAEELAATTQSNADALFRVMRFLAAFDVFIEVAPRSFGLTPLSEILRRDAPGSIRDVVLFSVEDFHWDAYRELGYGVQTGKPAFDQAFGQRPFQYFSEHPDVSLLVDRAMAVSSAFIGPAVAEAYDFSQFHTVMDVGGGNGTLLAAILRRHSRPRGILFDLPHAVEHARAAGLLPSERTQFEAGDMFESIPAGADAYVFSSVLHDWPDDKARSILQVCRRAMSGTGKLLVVEMLMTPDASLAHRFSDLEMLIVGGRERTAEDFRQLLASAGFRLDRIMPTKSPDAIIEGSPI